MEMKLLSNGVKHETVPEAYVVPPEKRPGNSNLAGRSETLPVIDLQGSNSSHGGTIANQIIEAGKEFGFFQVINHGIPEEVIKDMMGVAMEFFDLPLEDKAALCSEDPHKLPRLFTSTSFSDGKTAYWRDCFLLNCYPVEEFIHLFPGKPSNFREVVARYAVEAVGLGTRLLKLISRGLGLEEDYFTGKLSGGAVGLNMNHYPPCPDPTLTLGLPGHCDANLLTILLQGNVRGLQVSHGGDWVGIEPTPNALVVNFGHALEVYLDLGNYERFLDIKLTYDNNITTGKIYRAVIDKERSGDYLSKTVQVVPHITDEIQEWIERVAFIPMDGKEGPADVCVIELGGTIGDIESMPFIEALGQFSYRGGPGNFCLVHVSLVPVLNVVGEQIKDYRQRN